MQNSDTENTDKYTEADYYYEEEKNPMLLVYGLPSLLIIFILAGFFTRELSAKPNDFVKESFLGEAKLNSRINTGAVNIVSEEDLAQGLLDTVYTDKENWLELRIHEQMLYVHWRNGKIDKYPVSTGNKSLDKGLESRPGLFAIFVKEEHHESSQFDNADMYHFMPFNQGIGFHSINGTAYYQHLGVRPSSHGCIRMRHDHVKKLFGDVELGTIVLAHNGKYARTIGFAPKEYDASAQEFSPEEYKRMLAENLYNVLSGKYYVSGRKYFVIDPKIIPKQGVYIGYDRTVPDKQEVPKPALLITYSNDKLSEPEIIPGSISVANVNEQGTESSQTEFVSNENDKNTKKTPLSGISSTDEMVKKYFNNPIGILPYYPPGKR
ncbi:MAG: L,D-transpeptidase [Ignavibacteria bacterium]|nr:L,D-transpeptidase [Ignavibacteria bacterium]